MLAHTVEALVAGKISRVHCNTCGAQHAYRPEPPQQRPPKRSTASARGSQSERTTVKGAYQALIEGRDPSAALPYATTARFREMDLIDHPVFGLGIVTLDRGEKKIEVAFADKVRTLVHAG
jgi:hypothetical protein